MKPMKVFAVAACAAAALVMSAQPEGRGSEEPEPQAQSDPQSFRFRTGVELINVTATVIGSLRALRVGVCGRKTSASFRTTSPSRSRTSTASGCRSASGSCSTRAAAWSAKKWPPRATRSTVFSRSCSARTTRCSCTGSTRDPVLVEGWTTDKRAVSRAVGTPAAARRHRDVRRGRRGGAARADRTPPEEGAPHHLRRQRHEQPHGRAGAQADDSRNRGAGLRDRHRQPGRARAVAEALQPEQRSGPAPPAAACAHPVSVSIPRQAPPPPPSPPIYPPQPGPRGNNTPGGEATRASTSPPCATSPTTAAGARRSSAARAISIRRPPASRTS